MRRVVSTVLISIFILSGLIIPNAIQKITVFAQSAAPFIKRLAPNVIPAGTETFTLRLQGNSFSADAKVHLDGVPLATSRVIGKKGRLLLAEIEASVIASVGTHEVKAVNGDGQSSATLTLSVVQASAEVRMHLQGNATEAGHGSDLLFPISGEGFSDKTVAVTSGFEAVATTFINDELLSVQIAADLVENAARVPIYVRNKNGDISNAEIFYVVPQPAQINSIEPDTAEAGSEDLELIVRGDFANDAILVINDVPIPATLKRPGRLMTTLPASLLAQPGRIFVRVEQEGIQSSDIIFTVRPPKEEPIVFNVAPTRIRLGDKRPTVDLYGANLGDNLTVTLDDAKAKVQSSTKTLLRIVIPEEKQTSLGTHTIQITNEEGNTVTATFEIVQDVEVSTLVGISREGFNETTCVPAEEARLRRPRRIAVGTDHMLYVTDQQNHAIRRINPDTGEVCNIAGTTGDFGYHDSGNSAGRPVTFSFPNGLAVAPDGTIYVTENGNDVVRRISQNGGGISVDTIAGTTELITTAPRQEKLNATKEGIEGFRDGVASNAAFRHPDEIVIGPDGALYFTDPNNHAIRKVAQSGGQFMVETVAGNGVPGFIDGDGVTARFNTPTGLAISADGNFLYVADTGNNRVRKINLQTRKVETFAGEGSGGSSDGPGFIANFIQPIGLAFDANGILYVSEMGPGRIRRIDQQGNVTTLAGADSVKFREGPGSRATFNFPRGIAIDRGTLYVADYENFRIRKIPLLD
ncbi:MAG: SMP-30/gluconolactonase/LRE family protein [Acidobacteriota bacterium]